MNPTISSLPQSEQSEQPPKTLEPIFDNIPVELKELKQWVLWRWKWDASRGKHTKPPLNPETGQAASPTNPATWGTFEQATEAYEAGSFDGVGFVLTPDDPFCGWDFDDCVDTSTHKIAPHVDNYIQRLGGYSELSPTGTGIRVLVKAKLPPGDRRTGNVEVYDTQRYFTLTGHLLPGTTRDIPDRQQETDALHRWVFSADGRLIEKIATGEKGKKLCSLWYGSTSDYGDDDSSADLALCNYLRRLVGKDAERIDHLFRLSGLMREKWDEMRGSITYGERTINTSLTEPPDQDATGEEEEPPRILAVTDALDVPDPGPTRWIIPGILPESYLLLLAGRPKMGKTTLLFSIITAIAEGTSFADLPASRHKVLALLAEDDPSDVRKALEAAGLKERGQVLLLTLDGKLPRWEDLAQTALEHGCGVVIVDPQALLNRFKPGATGYEDVYTALYNARRILKEAGLAAISTTHVAKGKAVIREITDVIDAPMGTTAYSAVADGVAAFGHHPQNPDLRRLLGHGRKNVSFDLSFEFSGGLYKLASATEVLSPLAQEIHGLIKLTPSKSWTARQLREVVNRSNDDVQSSLRELREKDLLQFDKEGSRVLWHLPTEFILQ